MLSQKDIKALTLPSTKQYFYIFWLCLFMVLLFGVATVYNFYLSIYYANVTGLSFIETLSVWNEQTTLDEFYSGFIVESKHRLSIAIIFFGVAILTILDWWYFHLNRKRNRRIIKELIECGSITKEQLEN